MKHFTHEEATEALATVRPLAEQMVEQSAALRRARSALVPARTAVAGNGGGLDAARIQRLEAAAREAAAAVSACIEAIDAAGVQVKDVDRGLLDFPARHPATGETVLLCWHVGEEEIGFWHGLEEGFAGRKPLPL
jgi:hypothetical protein